MPLNKQDLETSKTISYHLRHKPEEINLVLDLEGWVNFDELIVKYNQKYNVNINKVQILEILNGSDKKRWEIDEATNTIRAIYGHSIQELEITYPKLEKPIELYHGTSTINIESIKQNGLEKRSRKFVHLTSDRDLAELTASRISKENIIIKIDTKAMLDDRKLIYKASELVYLVEYIEPKYLYFK